MLDFTNNVLTFLLILFVSHYIVNSFSFLYLVASFSNSDNIYIAIATPINRVDKKESITIISISKLLAKIISYNKSNIHKNATIIDIIAVLFIS